MITIPLLVVAVISTILMARRRREPADQYSMVSIWWMFPFVGVLTILTSTLPYYRFLNASAAPIALVGLGAFVAVRYFLRFRGPALVAGAIAALLVVGSLGWLLADGLQHRWIEESNQWANESVRTSLTAVNEVVQAAGERPIVLVINYTDADDATGSNTAYGWAKTYTNVFRTGIPGDMEQYSATYLGIAAGLPGGPADVEQHGQPELRGVVAEVLRRAAGAREGLPRGPRRVRGGPVLLGIPAARQQQAAQGLRHRAQHRDRARHVRDERARAVDAGRRRDRAGPGRRCRRSRRRSRIRPDPSAIPSTCCACSSACSCSPLLPGLIAAPMFELEDTPSRIALIPGHVDRAHPADGDRGPRGVAWSPHVRPRAWTVVGLTVAGSAVLRYARRPLLGVLESFGGFFNKLFGVFSNRDFATLMGVQFLAQAGQGVDPGGDRQVDRVRWGEGLRRLDRAVGGLPPEGRARAVRAVHADLAVHRRVHRPVPATQGRELDQRDRGRVSW